MSTITYQKVAVHLEKLKAIYDTLQIPKKEMKEIQIAIDIFQQYGDVSIEAVGLTTSTEEYFKKKTKPSFADLVDALFQQDYSELVGTKLNYSEFTTANQIMDYIDETSKTKIMKEASAIDLKLLYCILTEDKHEVKGTKNEVYEAIKRNIRAKKRGKAFLEFA